MIRQEEVTGSSEVITDAVLNALGRGALATMAVEHQGRKFVVVSLGSPVMCLRSWSDVQQVIHALRECGAQAFGPLPSEG